MKNKIVIILIPLLFIFFCQCKSNYRISSKDYTVIKYEEKMEFIRYNNIRPTELTHSEILKIEEIIHPKISNNLKKHKYFRQYVPFTDKNGDKIIWICIFCKDDLYSKIYETEIIEVADGGECVLTLEVNLTKKVCNSYSENSRA